MRRCIFQNLCVTNLNLWEITDLSPYFAIRENSAFETFPFLEKTSAIIFFFKFLNSIYFPLGCGAETILGTFWYTGVHFLKNIISQLWPSHEWSYDCLNFVGTLNSRPSNKKTGCYGAVKLHVSNSTLWELSGMVSMKSVAFVLFEILRNLVSMKNYLNANNCWHKQNFENCPTWPDLHFWWPFRICCRFFVKLDILGYRKCC